MIKKTIPHFNIAQIGQSGQCFRMSPINPQSNDSSSYYQVIAQNHYLEVKQDLESCTFFCSEEEFKTFWKNYFHLDQDYNAYICQIDPDDLYLIQAAKTGSGIRILRQDLWEMIVSFLISQQNNIVRIRRCIENLCSHYGPLLSSPSGVSYYGFPEPKTLAALGDDDLMACNLGYRSKYVIRTAKSIADGTVSLNVLSTLPYEKARLELLKLYGVGEKVADCICLFALGHLQAFPVDTHIRQVLTRFYPQGFPKRYKAIQGVLQQYIFYYELHGLVASQVGVGP